MIWTRRCLIVVTIEAIILAVLTLPLLMMIIFAGDNHYAQPDGVVGLVALATLCSPVVALLSVIVAHRCLERGYYSAVWGVAFFLPFWTIALLHGIGSLFPR